MKNNCLYLFLTISFFITGCTTINTIDVLSRKVALLETGADILIAGADALSETKNEPRLMTNNGGRFLQIITFKDGFFRQEFETDSNQACLNLAETIGFVNGSRFRCTDLSVESSLKATGSGIATLLSTNTPYKLRTENQEKCFAASADAILRKNLIIICN